jgi:hypothetical protein
MIQIWPICGFTHLIKIALRWEPMVNINRKWPLPSKKLDFLALEASEPVCYRWLPRGVAGYDLC